MITDKLCYHHEHITVTTTVLFKKILFRFILSVVTTLNINVVKLGKRPLWVRFSKTVVSFIWDRDSEHNILFHFKVILKIVLIVAVAICENFWRLNFAGCLID